MSVDQSSGMVKRGGLWSWVTLKATKGRVGLAAQGRVEYPDMDSEDFVAPELPEEMRSVWTQFGKQLAPAVTVGVDASRALMRVVSLPEVADGEMGDMVALQIDKFSPFPLDTQSLSYEILSEDDGMCRVLLAAVNRSDVEALGDACREAKMKLGRVDLDILGWWHLIRNHAWDIVDGVAVVVVLEEDRVHLVVCEQDVPHVFLCLGREGLGREDLIDEVITEIRLQLASLDERSVNTASWRGVIWESGSSGDPLGPVVAARLGDACEFRDLNELPSLAEGIASREIELGSKGLDLSLEEWHVAAVKRAARLRMIKVAACVLLVWGIMLGVGRGALAVVEKDHKALVDRKATLNPTKVEAASLEKSVETLGAYHDKNRSAVECLRLISMNLPAGVELKKYTYNKDKQIAVSGESARADSVHAFRDAMAGNDMFVDVKLAGITTTRGRSNFNMILLLSEEDQP